MNKQYLAMIIATLVVVVGAAWGIAMTIGTQTTAKAPTEFVPGPKSSERLEQLSKEMEKTAQYEMSYGCTETNEIGQKILCGESKEKMKRLEAQYNAEYKRINKRSEEDIAKVKDHVRKVSEHSSIEIEFMGVFNSPYTDKKPKRVEYYKDNRGVEYMVDPTINKVVEFTDESMAFEEPVKHLNVTALRAKAESYLVKVIPDFAEVKKSYVLEQGSKGDPRGDTMYAFRWNAPAKINGEDIPPYIMVKFSPSGKLIGFSDTRSLYQ